ncbi:MAG: GTP-binding protein [Deltaproteobacteria bacterium]|nr:GTP-binding protein [Deltaproteobacteria bacterium]
MKRAAEDAAELAANAAAETAADEDADDDGDADGDADADGDGSGDADADGEADAGDDGSDDADADGDAEDADEEDAEPIPEPTFHAPTPDEPIRLAVLGRPNVGKSTLLNRLLGEERFVASALPGTTRDAVDETLVRDGRTFVLTDTAGLRKKRQVIDKVEVFSAQRALRAVENSDVVVVLTDASELGVDQDSRIAAQAEERGRAVILCVNKGDLVKDKEAEATRLRDEAKRHLQHVGWAPLLFVSAKEGTRVEKILELAAQLRDESCRRLSTPELNAWLQDSQDTHPAPLWNGFPVRFFYAYQVAAQPPTIVIQTNRPGAVDDAYKRFLLHGLRDRFKLRVPVRLLFKLKSRAQPRGKGERA